MTDNNGNVADPTTEVLDEHFPRFLIHPFEVIRPDDPRYKNAYTHEEIMKMTDEPAQQ